MKKFLSWLLALAVIAGLGYYALKQYNIWPFEDQKKKETTFSNMLTLAEYVNQQMVEGADGKLTVYIQGISDEEIKRINYYLDTMNGSVSTVTQYTSMGKSRKIVLDIERSDSSYVYDKIKKGVEIPSDKTGALILYQKVLEIKAQCDPGALDDYSKELKYHDYLVNHCTYGNSKLSDNSEYTAYGALVNGKAVCSGYAAAMNLLLKCADVDVRFVVGIGIKYDDSGKESKENHAWNQVKIGGKWYNLDATWDDPVGAGDILSHEYFNVSDEILEKNHSWDAKETKKCDSMDANYYVKKSLYFKDQDTMQNMVLSNFNSGASNELEFAVGANVTIGDEDLQFLYDVPGLYGAQYSVGGSDNYRIVNIKLQR